MTIAKGRPWGEQGVLPDDGVMVRSDHEARAAVTAALASGRTPPPLGLLGGDLARTLGAPGDAARLRSADAMRFPLDLGTADIDGEHHWFVAHAIARRSWWRGQLVAAMNAEWLGKWDVTPRAHPNDGWLDVLETTMPLDDRLKARSRLRTGAHLPHPDVSVRRVRAVTLDLDRPLDVWLDGERVARSATITLGIVPDALIGYV